MDAFAGYDVVVIGENGGTTFDYFGTQIFAALRDFVDLGRGVVTTGVFANAISKYGDATGDADYISPAAPSAAGEFLYVVPGSLIDINPLDRAGEIIAGGITDYSAQGYHEVAEAVDGTATVLAIDSSGRAAIAYDEVGAGRTVYLGSVHMAADFPFLATETRTAGSPVDQLFEQAVAWAAGDRGGSGAAANESTVGGGRGGYDTAAVDITVAGLAELGGDLLLA